MGRDHSSNHRGFHSGAYTLLSGVNMETLAVPALKQAIKHIAVDMHEPIMIRGQPGAGKSDAVRQVAWDHYLSATAGAGESQQYDPGDCPPNMADIRLSQYDSVDLRGLPGVSKTTHLTTWYAPSTIPFKGNPAFVENDQPIFFFLDEINSALPEVMAVAYQLVLERRVGKHRLMDNVVIIAAGNRDTDRGVTNRMPLPLCNRFTWFELVVDVDAWCEWALSTGLPPIAVAFYKFRRELLNTFDPTSADPAFSTPRSVAKAMRFFSADMPDTTKRAAMAGAMGKAPTTEFWAFKEMFSKMVKISTILKDPEGAPLPREAGMRYAITVAISGAMKTGETTTPLHKYLSRMEPEYQLLAWKMGVSRDSGLLECPEYLDFARTFRSLLV